MIYILVALEDELSKRAQLPDGVLVRYTGVGKVNATLHATWAATQQDCECIINYGTAGALNSDYAGKLTAVKVVKQRDMDARPLAALGVTPFDPTEVASDIHLPGHGASLSTGDNFVMAPPELPSDLVDMEAYGIVKTAQRFGKNVHILKFGSDLADENAADNWVSNCAKGEKLFLEWLLSHMAETSI